MNVTNLVANGLARPRSRTSDGVDGIAQSFQKVDKRIEQRRDAVSVQLSSSGKLKSSFSEAQQASSALGDIRKIDSESGITKAAGNFVRAFNNAAQTARSVVTEQAGSADSKRARLAEVELRRSFSSDAAVSADLKGAGISQQMDGSLAIDSRKFEAALKSDPESLRSTLARAGQLVDQVATREVSGSSRGRSANSVDERARTADNRQTEQQAQAMAAEQLVSAQAAKLNNSVNPGIAAYQRIFSL